jgi:hypothetical protein
MKFFTVLFSALLVSFCAVWNANAQVSFTNNNSQLTNDTHSGCSVTIVDVDGDGLDDIVRLDDGRSVYIAYQRPGQPFEEFYLGDFNSASGWAWAMCVADVDHNGLKDVLAGGYGPAVKVMTLASKSTTNAIVSLPNSSFFLQNANFADINNDGWADIFACERRCRKSHLAE